MTDLSKIAEAVEANTAETKSALAGLEARLAEMEQKGDSLSRGTVKPAGDAVAAAIVGSAEIKCVAERRATKAGVSVNASDLLLERKNLIVGDTGDFATSTRPDMIVGGLQRRVWLRESLATAIATGGSVEWTRESAFFNNAATQGKGDSPPSGEGGAKAESTIAFELVDSKIPTVAHFVKTSRQVLSDVPALRGFLDMRLRYGLEIELERQMIAGDGSGGDMLGFLADGNHVPFTPLTGEDPVRSTRRAVAQLQVNEATPDLIVLNPLDWAVLELVSDGQERFLFGDPTGADPAMLWRQRVLVSNAIEQGQFIAMDTQQAAALWLRQAAQVIVSDSDGDDFTKNIVTILAEMRAVLTVLRPAAVIAGPLVA